MRTIQRRPSPVTGQRLQFPIGADAGSNGALTAFLLLAPLAPKLGAALIASVTNAPGERGSWLVRAETYVFTWREASPHVADRLLLEGLIEEMELRLASDKRLHFEQTAGAWWYNQHTVSWPTEIQNGLAGWRMREWSLADRVIPSLGTTVDNALPHDDAWTSLPARQRLLARSFAESISGLFVVVAATANGELVEDAFDAKRYDVIVDDSNVTTSEQALYLGRLVPRHGGVYLTSPGTARFGLRAALSQEMRDTLRLARDGKDRMLYAEMVMGTLCGGAPVASDLSYVNAEAAAQMIRVYERECVVARSGNVFRAPGVEPQPLDDATVAWIALLRERAES